MLWDLKYSSLLTVFVFFPNCSSIFFAFFVLFFYSDCDNSKFVMSTGHRRVRYFINNLPDYCDNVSYGEGTCDFNASLRSNTNIPTAVETTTATAISTASISEDSVLTSVNNENQTDTGSITQPHSEFASDTNVTKTIHSSTLAPIDSPLDTDNSNTVSMDVPKIANLQSNVIIDRCLIKKRIIHLVNLIVEKQKCTSEEADCDGGLYVGISGIAYMFNYLASATGDLFNSMERDFFTKQALRYLGPTIDYANSLEKNDRLSSVAYLLGFAGTFVAASLIYHNINDTVNRDFYINKYSQISSKCLPIHYLTKGSDELLVGRAGYICGATILNKSFKDNKVIPEGVLLALALSSIKSGREYSVRKGLKNICPLMYCYYGTDYLGAAHGLAGILQALLAVPGIFNPKLDLERDVKRSVDYLLSLQTDSGNFPCALDELIEPTKGITIRSEEDELVHWCHGAPGVIWLMARAYLIWKEDKYLDCCIKCGELVWNKGLLRKGPGICHGVAGNALVFLVLYRLTGKPKYLHRANQFQEFLFTDEFRLRSRTPDSPYSMFEGWAGTICFLTDLLQPEKSHFPLSFDPFDDISQLYKEVEPRI